MINISVSLLVSFLPVPGGIGVLATALLYRGATFYIPPIWEFFAMRWLQPNTLL